MTDPLAFLQERRRAYCLAFGSPAGQAVLQDLTKFCRAATTCFDRDPRVHAALEGRREVWLRIQEHMNLSPEELHVLYTGGYLPRRAQDPQGEPDAGS